MIMLTLGLATATPAPAQTVSRGLAPVEQSSVEVRLADHGWQDGLQLRGHFDRRTVHLPTLPALGPNGGWLQLDLEASLPHYRFASLEIRVNGRSAAAVDLLELGQARVEAALTSADLAQPFVAVAAVLRGSIANDRCTDERIAGGFVTIRPTSDLVLATAHGSRPDIWQTIESLPRRVEIGIAGDASEPRLLAAALQTAATLTRAGHEPTFRLPDRASDDPAFELIALEAEASPPDVIIGDPAMVRAALATVNGFSSEPVVPADLRSDPGLGIASIDSGTERAILAVTPESASGLAALVGHGMTLLAAGAAAAVLPALEPWARRLAPYR